MKYMLTMTNWVKCLLILFRCPSMTKTKPMAKIHCFLNKYKSLKIYKTFYVKKNNFLLSFFGEQSECSYFDFKAK